MTFDPARPRYTLPFAGTEYELLGTMGLIEAVEFALKRGITQIAVDVTDVMQSVDLVRLVSAVLTACDHKMTVSEARALLWDKVGLAGDENLLLRVHLYNFLAICLAPPEQREAKAKAAGELLGRLTTASPGPSTNASV